MFKDGSRCGKSLGDLTKWVKSSYVDFCEDVDVKEEALKGPQHFIKEVEKGYKEITRGKVFDIPVIEKEEISDKDVLTYLNSLVPVINAEAADKRNTFLMVESTGQNRVSSVTYTSWSAGQNPEYVKAITSNARYVVLKYYPTDIRSFIPFKQGNVPLNILNTYLPPKHRLDKIEVPKIPKLVVEYLKRLFVNKECYEFMMESIWYILNSRLQVIPVLNGGTGIGKGLFTEHLLGNLVGQGNAILAPKSWDKSGFNAWLLNKQLIVFDEAKIISNGPDANVDYLKRLMNDSLNVERKGVDADKLTENHASFFITSNNGAKRFKLELDNRRFAPVDVTDQKIERIYKSEEIEELVKLIDSPDVVANIYWEIQHNWSPEKRVGKRTPYTILQCEALYRFQYESLDIWQRAITELILSKESDEYMGGEINAQYRKVYTRITGRETNSKRAINKVDIKDFLQSYRHYEDKEPMGYVKDDDSDGEMVVAVAKKYKAKHGSFKEVGISFL